MSAQTPLDIRWPVERIALPSHPNPRPVAAPKPEASETDVLWATAGFVADPVVGFDSYGCVNVWNPAAELAFGWPALDVIGFPPPFLPEDKRMEQAQLLAAACRGETVRDVPSVRKRIDGSLVRVRISAVGHADGAAFVVKPDPIPERSSPIRPALHPVATHDEGGSTDNVAGMKRFISAVVHDLNNLFTVVCSGSESLIERHAMGDPRRTDSEMIYAAGLHAARLVRQLAGLTSDVPSLPSLADLTAVLREMAPVMRGILGTSRELTIDAVEEPVHVAVDPARLSQVLLNLTANARDAMPAGGAVSISTRLEETGRVVLSVHDTGPGIDPIVRTRLFEPNVSTKSKSRGIGLATVAEVVSNAGGRIAVESAPGEGTTVILDLPLAGTGEEGQID
jgi:signal transduction histidine kinase